MAVGSTGDVKGADPHWGRRLSGRLVLYFPRFNPFSVDILEFIQVLL